MDLLQALHSSRAELVDAIGGLTDGKASAKPGEGRWSVLETLEHIGDVEERFLARIESGAKEGAPPVNPAKEASFAAKVVDRTQKVQAPEAVAPKGRFTSVADALARFTDARAKSMEFVTRQGAEVEKIAGTHPRFGELNGREMVLFLCGHCRRHTAQIRETRAAIGA